MRISSTTLNRKINSFLDQLQNDDSWVALYPQEMPIERATIIAKSLGWKGGTKDVLYPCYSLENVVVRRLA